MCAVPCVDNIAWMERFPTVGRYLDWGCVVIGGDSGLCGDEGRRRDLFGTA